MGPPSTGATAVAAKAEAESDDSMPPLLNAGSTETKFSAGSKVQSIAIPDAQNDDEMPPLQYVGNDNAKRAPSSATGKHGTEAKPKGVSTSVWKDGAVSENSGKDAGLPCRDKNTFKPDD